MVRRSRWAVALLALAVSASAVPNARAAADYLAWVTNSKDGTLSVVDLSTYAVLGTVTVGNNPRGIAPAGDGDVLAVALQGADEVAVVTVDGGVIAQRIAVGHKPYDLAIDPRTGEWGWVSLLAAGQVQNVDETGVQATVDVGRRPAGVAFDPKGRRAAVACSGSDEVYLLDRQQPAARVSTKLAAGRKPMDVAFDRKGRRLAVSNFKDNTVTVFDARTGSVDETLQTARGPRGVAWSPKKNNVAAVAQSRSRSVRLFDGNDVVDVAVGKKPIEVAFTPDGKRVVVTNSGDGTISVIDVATRSVVATVGVGQRPWGVAIVEKR